MKIDRAIIRGKWRHWLIYAALRRFFKASPRVLANPEKQKGELAFAPSTCLAEWTGLEPATPGVTGRYSNQLNYHSKSLILLVGADGIEPPTFAL
jgi:hypothetical protein